MSPTPDRAASRPPREPRLSAFFSPIADPALDAGPARQRELEREIEGELRAMRRDVVVGQRGARCAIAFGAALVAAAAGSASSRQALMLVMTWLLYAALVFGMPAALREGDPRSLRSQRWLPPAIITADLLALGIIFAVTRPALLGQLFLAVALLPVWAAGFHVSWYLSTYAAALGAAIYAGIARPPSLGPAAQGGEVAAHLAMFVLVAVVLNLAHARFRGRVQQLLVFCRQVGDGDVGVRLTLVKSHSPDDVTALARSVDTMRKRLAEQIGVDSLTGCLNRRALESRLRGEWRLARRRQGQITVLAVDLDHFKQINDVHGHAIGDIVLQQFAGIMKGIARESDVVARLGGDEFVLVLPDTDVDGAHMAAERVREQVAESVLGTSDDPVRVTVSVGAALARGQDDISTTDILEKADRALYLSKQGGRNRVSLGS